MSHRVSLDDVRLGNIKPMIEAIKEYSICHREKVNLHKERMIAKEVK